MSRHHLRWSRLQRRRGWRRAELHKEKYQETGLTGEKLGKPKCEKAKRAEQLGLGRRECEDKKVVKEKVPEAAVRKVKPQEAELERVELGKPEHQNAQHAASRRRGR